MMIRTVLMVLALSFLAACKSKDKSAANADEIFLDYKVMGEEGNDNLVITAQFRNDEEDAIALAPGASVLLDGQQMEADSSKYTGYTYEAYQPIDSFTGEHKLIYTNAAGDKKETSFSFAPLRLVTSIPDTLSREDLELEFTGLGEKASVRLILIDTSFANEEINHVEMVKNGRLVIPASSFQTISPGPVQLELVLESEKRLKEGQQGRVLIMYTLRREFMLKD